MRSTLRVFLKTNDQKISRDVGVWAWVTLQSNHEKQPLCKEKFTFLRGVKDVSYIMTISEFLTLQEIINTNYIGVEKS